MADEIQNQEKTFTQADIDNLNAEHQKAMDALAGKLRAEFKDKEAKAKAEAEKLAKQANMSELEKAQNEATEWQTKYNEAQSVIDLATQKDETRKKMAELGVDEKYLKYVFAPKDMKATEENIKSLKADIDEIKKVTFESNVKSTIPGAGGGSDDAQLAAMRKAAGLK
jgi:hypothetical protein